jgi:hypothetical protein
MTSPFLQKVFPTKKWGENRASASILDKETNQKLNTFLGIPGCFNAKT